MYIQPQTAQTNSSSFIGLSTTETGAHKVSLALQQSYNKHSNKMSKYLNNSLFLSCLENNSEDEIVLGARLCCIYR